MRLKNGCELFIEEVVPEDAEEVIAYLNRVGGESNHLTFGKNEFPLDAKDEEIMIQNILNHPLDKLWKGVVDGRIVSVCNFSTQPKKREAHRAGFGISVSKSHWHMGIATAMLTHMLKYAKSRPEIILLVLEVVADNTRAIQLYTSLGFEKQGIYHKYIKVDAQYYDAYYMEQEILHE